MKEIDIAKAHLAFHGIGDNTRSLVIAEILDTGDLKIFYHGISFDHIIMAEVVKAQALQTMLKPQPKNEESPAEEIARARGEHCAENQSGAL